MENYTKGKNVEEPLEKEKIPIPNLPEKFIWMQVTGGSKMRNLLNYALKAFKDERSIVWSGSGGGMGKAISCAEIVKRRNKDLHQITKICYRKVEEYWEPQMENLDTLVVIREIPTIHILLSKDPLDKNEPGYQAPGSFDTFWRSTEGSSEHVRKQNQPKRNRGPRVSNEEFAAMGLRSDQRKPKHAGSGRIPPKSGGDRQRRIGTSGGGSESGQQT
ncbi:ribonuclease P protein subunit p25-like protein isoform X1 [Schistocerca serialis cubense]|uniref:ribonuclease P protein subunit p25-like protein isoform X1 n=1 Tax=Schistocerca serialis cubense TaxID=2023355 RepID=UPI00214E6950|nr:ribonuclease P protein subunit p25-like protein isoform X1 [Schistocerca serialis cubense]